MEHTMEDNRRSKDEMLKQMEEKMKEEMKQQERDFHRALECKMQEQKDLLEKGQKEKADLMRQEIEEFKKSNKPEKEGGGFLESTISSIWNGRCQHFLSIKAHEESFYESLREKEAKHEKKEEQSRNFRAIAQGVIESVSNGLGHYFNYRKACEERKEIVFKERVRSTSKLKSGVVGNIPDLEHRTLKQDKTTTPKLKTGAVGNSKDN
ncbi:unnamed protein product [Coregonus sp. 'balchen']|nr:unnamed protein product [Coregonus sp. 'balchen']